MQNRAVCICGEDCLIEKTDSGFTVSCEKCGIKQNKTFETENDALIAWNGIARGTCTVIESGHDEIHDVDYTDLSCGHTVRMRSYNLRFCPYCSKEILQ